MALINSVRDQVILLTTETRIALAL